MNIITGHHWIMNCLKETGTKCRAKIIKNAPKTINEAAGIIKTGRM